MRALDRDADSDEALEEARQAYARKLWRQAHSAYTAVRDNALMADDIERYAIAAHLVGNDAESGELLARGHRESLARDDVLRAVRFAFWIGHSMIFTGERAQAGGWWRRARSLLTEHAVDCAEWGMVLFADAVQQLLAGDVSTALETLAQVEVIGRRFADRDVLNGALFLRGRAFIQLGQCAEGMAALDEVMVAVTSGELHPLRVGHAYCGVLQACWEVFDVRRAREWTAALTRWCEDQPDLVPYRGPCLVHRVELLRLRGDWQDALEEARRACDWLTQSTTPETPADAFYQLGELHRLRGDFAAADQAYRQASRLGRQVEPGVALLWLARGQADAAAAALRRVLDEPGPTPAARSELLDAYIEILLAMHEIATAQAASTELEQIAATLDAVPLRARADSAIGSVLLAQGEARAALAPLRRS